MSRFNTRSAKPDAQSPVTTTGETTRTFEGAVGHVRDAKSELFLLAVSNLDGKDTFYERAADRDDRFRTLVRGLAVADPEWTANLLKWLRSTANMRTASVVGACEFVHARLEFLRAVYSRCTVSTSIPYTHVSLNRKVVDWVLQRPDEPGELIAYWTTAYGRRLPKPVKRGVADAVRRLYTERALLKYDTNSKGYRFGDVLELVHAAPDPGKRWQGDLFKHAIDRRHNRDEAVPARLSTLIDRERLMATPVDQRRSVLANHPDLLQSAGMTWESVAGWLQGPMDKAAWEAVIPSMGLMALVRNLRNFDQAGVSDAVAASIAALMSDPRLVAQSRMLPFRFWSAYKNVASLRWGHALETALNLSLANVPTLGRRTLILVDRSPSMFPGYGFSTPNDSDVSLAEQAAVFGAALALKAEKPTLVEFGRSSRVLPVSRGGSILRLVEQFEQIDGTDIPSAVKQHFDGHDRVIIVTDEQTRPGWLPSNRSRGWGGMPETPIDDLVPKHVPVYMWNMAGYKPGAMPSGSHNRHTLGGLSDAAFGLIPLLERGRDAQWPWQ